MCTWVRRWVVKERDRVGGINRFRSSIVPTSIDPPFPYKIKNSYRQARSLQAHALQWHHDHHRQHDPQTPPSSPLLYYYTIDFRGEPCALHGAVLERQASFVSRALATVAGRHQQRQQGDGGGDDEGKERGVSVLVVGHSYGGMVAKGGVAEALALGKEVDGVNVPVLLTLGAPHQR